MARPETVDLLARLIGFDTTSRNSNLSLIDFAEAYLSDHGFACERVPSPDGQKANLWATVGPADVPGYVLSGPYGLRAGGRPRLVERSLHPERE